MAFAMAFASMRFMGLGGVPVGLPTFHEIKEQLTVNRTFCMAISSHVSGVTPLDFGDHT